MGALRRHGGDCAQNNMVMRPRYPLILPADARNVVSNNSNSSSGTFTVARASAVFRSGEM